MTATEQPKHRGVEQLYEQVRLPQQPCFVFGYDLSRSPSRAVRCWAAACGAEMTQKTSVGDLVGAQPRR